MPTKHILIAAVEGGGTSFRVVVCQVDDPERLDQVARIIHRTKIDSSHDNPQLVLAECVEFLKQHKPAGGYHALGVALFGPVGVRADHPETYGTILPSTPKKPWRGVNVLQALREACEGKERVLRVRVDTDVNAPALAEYEQRPDTSIESCAYVTVGTGVGAGIVIKGECVHGMVHPELGHVKVQPLDGDCFGGYSWGADNPFGGRNTVEALASSVALTERLEQMENRKHSSRDVLADLSDEHEVWDHCANALANLCVTLIMTLSMERIVLGGGLMQRPGLLDKVRHRTSQLVQSYPAPANMSNIIVTSQFGSDAGLIGTIMLAQRALLDKEGVIRAHEHVLERHAYMKGAVQGTMAGLLGSWFLFYFGHIIFVNGYVG